MIYYSAKFATLVSLMAAVVCMAQPLVETKLTAEQVEALERTKNRVSPIQGQLKSVEGFLEVYSNLHHGEWPKSWQLVENEFGVAMWESKEARQLIIHSFALLPGILGNIKTRDEGEFNSTLMMATTEPIEREVARGVFESGRWVLWKTFRGQIVTRWHPEVEIKTFSAWSSVEAEIANYIQRTSSAESGTSTTPPPSTKLFKESESKFKTPESKLATQPVSTPQLVWAVLIVSATGLLWLLLKRRAK